ncbi:Uncharacterised protein [Mycobacteroides abscessus subsp. abscessus]|nr:Uncharacterised protein [Mycobacteroides abscessus subsp. abscessus]
MSRAPGTVLQRLFQSLDRERELANLATECGEVTDALGKQIGHLSQPSADVARL